LQLFFKFTVIARSQKWEAVSIVQGIRSYYPLLGTRGVFQLAKSRFLRRPIQIQVSAPGILHPIHLRVGTSDISLFRDIVLNKEYEWELPAAPRVIVDAGANIGLSSIFYANRYPEARIICVEPEPFNALMLRKNMAYYPNSVVVEAALWNKNEPVSIVDPGLGEWGFRTIPKGSSARGITVDRLMDQCSIDYIDLLKADIEGAEREVFENPSKWIDRLGAIVIEPHDRFKVGCSRALYLATPDFAIEGRRGEMVFLARDRKAQLIESTICSATRPQSRENIGKP
jgi:FkbM family methyltransferase